MKKMNNTKQLFKKKKLESYYICDLDHIILRVICTPIVPCEVLKYMSLFCEWCRKFMRLWEFDR
jgi:hypothetical protein